MRTSRAAQSAGRPEPERRRSVLSLALAGGAIGLLTAVVLIIAGGSRSPAADVAAPSPAPADAMWAAGTRPAPDFTLTDQDGRALQLSSLRGRVVLLTFLDSHCTHLCRIEGPSLGVVQRALPDAERPVIVAVSVNAEDSAASVHAAARDWGWSPGDWQWLMGNPVQLAEVWAAYGVDVRQTVDDVQHSGVLYVIDPAGNERAGYATPFLPRRVTRSIRTLSGASW